MALYGCVELYSFWPTHGEGVPAGDAVDTGRIKARG